MRLVTVTHPHPHPHTHVRARAPTPTHKHTHTHTRARMHVLAHAQTHETNDFSCANKVSPLGDVYIFICLARAHRLYAIVLKWVTASGFINPNLSISAVYKRGGHLMLFFFLSLSVSVSSRRRICRNKSESLVSCEASNHFGMKQLLEIS